MAFFKSKAFVIWIVLNGLFPLGVGAILSLDSLPGAFASAVLWSCIALILIGNIFGYARFPVGRAWFAGIAFLNIFSLVAVGAISFVTSIPSLPLVLTTLYELIT